ncbi:MAG: lipoate--protein ligase [Lawsonibacter sp.]
MIYLESRDTRSDFNLALEQYVFDRLPQDESYFMLWRNSPSVIVGKYQNTLEEVDTDFVRKEDIRVTRRLSGGGAVYHDLGNINYTFIVPGSICEGMDLALFCQPLIQTLGHIGIQAQLSGRNDLTIGGKKFSGTAQYCKDGRIMHHGTILYHSDLTVLGRALRPAPVKIASKGIQSVRSRVTNIWDCLEHPVPIEEFWELLRRYMAWDRGATEGRLTRADLDGVELLRRERYSTWEWNWGRSPKCTVCKERRVEGCGTIQIFLEVEHGRIRDCQFFGDFFGEGASPELLAALRGCQLEHGALTQALERVDVRHCFYCLPKQELVTLLMQ